MVRMRSSLTGYEVEVEIRPGDRERMTELFGGEGFEYPDVPVGLRSTGGAAVYVDDRCLRNLSSNAKARSASMMLAATAFLAFEALRNLFVKNGLPPIWPFIRKCGAMRLPWRRWRTGMMTSASA